MILCKVIFKGLLIALARDITDLRKTIKRVQSDLRLDVQKVYINTMDK